VYLSKGGEREREREREREGGGDHQHAELRIVRNKRTRNQPARKEEEGKRGGRGAEAG